LASAKPYLVVGLRGVLAMHPGVRTQWEAGELEEDAFSLIAKRSEILGLAEFSGDRHAIAHWGHCDAGGTWTQDGAEHLLAWLQVDVRTDATAGERRLLPIASTLAVVRDALAQVGALTLTEADAIVPLGLMADPLSRLAAGRDWLLSAPAGGPRRKLVVTLDAGGSAAKLDPGHLEESLGLLGDEVLGPVAVAPARSDALPAEFLQHRFTRGAVELRATTSSWSVDTAAWVIEHAARACMAAGVREPLLIAVRTPAAEH
jgi:hypothetical protein